MPNSAWTQDAAKAVVRIAALESGDKFLDIFNSPPTKFSETDHLANTITQVQQVQKDRWVLVKDNLIF